MSEYRINICLACDNNYAKHAGVVIASILANANQEDLLDFCILDGGIKKNNKEDLLKLKKLKNCNIQFIQIDKNIFKEYAKIKTHNYVTIATYYRLKLPTLLPDINKIIYFDCDFVINTSLKELFNIDISNYLLAGVLDTKRKKVVTNPTYVNAGMLVFNLKKMREFDIENKFLSWSIGNTAEITCGDQEIINEVCKGKIKLIDAEWNVQSSNFTNRSSYTNNPKCIHFVSKKKPWNFGSYSYHKEYYYKYLQLTPWSLSRWKQFLWGPVNKFVSCIKYVGYRPFFLLRPRFYEAIFHTYIKPNIVGDNK